MEELTIYTYTVVRTASAQFSGRVPYCVAILERPDGARFSALVEGYRDGDTVCIGQSVRRIPDPEGGPARYSLH